MRLLLFLSALQLVLWMSLAHAGPWPRDTGSGFYALSGSLSALLESSQSAYLEYGLRDDLTLAGDVTLSRDGYGQMSGAVGTVLLRWPLATASETHLWALEAGLGADWNLMETTPHLQTGLSWGRGIGLRDLSGWATIDAALRWTPRRSETQARIDGTLGLNLTDKSAAMLQVFLREGGADPATKLSASFIRDLGGTDMRLQIGIETVPNRSRQRALKLGLWREF